MLTLSKVVNLYIKNNLMSMLFVAFRIGKGFLILDRIKSINKRKILNTSEAYLLANLKFRSLNWKIVLLLYIASINS